MKRIVIAAAIALSAAASLAQTASESIEVRVVNVDVVVRDRAGKPVTGLTKDDFEIYENGQKREITNLYEVRPPSGPPSAAAKSPAATEAPAATEPPPVEIRPRNIVMFVDNYSLQPFRRDKVLQSLRKFIDEQLRRQDRVMLVLCTQQVNVITPFTNDKKAIADGIESLKKVVGASQNRWSALEQLKGRINQFIDAAKEPRAKVSFAEYYSMSTTLVDAFVDEETFSARNTLSALGQTTAALAGIEGRNVVIFAGAHLPESPGKETYLWLYNAFSPYIPSLTLPSEGLSGRAGGTRYSIEEAAKQASANNVALYLIDAADSRDAISAEGNGTVDHTEQFASFTNTAMAYQTLARISGGMALTNSDNFDAAFQTLAADLNAYYSVGFKPGDATPDKPRSVEVKMKNPAYRSRARETYNAKAPAAPQDEMSTRVTANLYTTDPRNEWEIHLKPGTPEKQGSEYQVPFEITMAPTITLAADGDNLVGNFVVYVIVGSGESTSKVVRNTHAVKVPADAEDDFRDKQITYKAAITMTPGDNILSVAVVDPATNMAGFARVKVTVP